MVQFTTTISQFAGQGEKTGWTYINVPAGIAALLKPGYKKSFRVKGTLDNLAIKAVALLPMGNGDFIMALNATMRKAIKKRKGDALNVQLETDEAVNLIPAELLECLADEPKALAFFSNLSTSHQHYFGNWINAAKTDATRARRIAQAVTALARSQHYGDLLRQLKEAKKDQL